VSRFLIGFFSVILLCSHANAQGIATFFYQKGIIQIARANPPPLPNLPWQPENTPTLPDTSLVSVSVDIRPVASLYRQEGWINMEGLSGLSGMMFISEKPEQTHIGPMEYYQPLDVIWLDNNGVITSIAPNLVLASNKDGLSDSRPSKALLMLAGGSAQLYGIAPGDKIVGSEFFDTPPNVISIQP
jgi:uncharacterized membrane protein (UPF0127 family)